LIEGVSDGLAGAARLADGALADDPERRRVAAVGDYTTTAVLSGLIGVATSAWQVGLLRAGAWAARGLRVPPATPCWRAGALQRGQVAMYLARELTASSPGS
jgi:hypothetical protein